MKPVMEIQIVQAESSDLYAVWRLTYDAYLAEKYIQVDLRRTFSLYSYLELGRCTATTVLLAMHDEELLGTVSITKDSRLGLHTDVDFHKETEVVRRTGVSLASSWRIVTKQELRGNVAVVKALMQAVVRHCVEWGIEVLLGEFHPRHEEVYCRLFRAETIGRRDATQGLMNAPAVLLRFGTAEVPARWT